MVALCNVLVFVAGASSFLIPCSAATIQADLITINGDAKNLITLLDNWNSQISTSVPIQNAEQKLESNITTGTKNANASAVLSSSDSSSILSYITNTLEPNIKAAITALDNNKAKTQSAGLISLVRNDLASLKNKTASYGNALIAKSSSD